MRLQKKLHYFKNKLVLLINILKTPYDLHDDMYLQNALHTNLKFVEVESLLNGRLNLDTGLGIVYTFRKKGEVRKISFYHLRNIINYNYEMAKKQRYYIHDDKVAKTLGIAKYNKK